VPQALPAERRERILEVLRERRAVRVSDLVGSLGVSEVTVRRDLEELERRGFLERTHGGAVLVGAPAPTPPAQARPAEKRAIGAAAARLVDPGEAVYLNGGTTTLEVFRHLSVPCTVITNNLLVAAEPPRRDIEILLLGGHLRIDPVERTVVGPFATEALRRTFAARAFLGVGGIALSSGVTTPVAAEAEIARAMIEQTRGDVVVVADRSKLGTVADFAISSLEPIGRLVVDAGIGEDYLEGFLEAGVEVLEAGASAAGEAGRG
jgi:DeoR family fructose operon transcriptional repressor